MLNNEKLKKFNSNENNLVNTEDVQRNSKLSKIETKVEKSGDKITIVPRSSGSITSEKQQDKPILIDNYGAADPIIDILDDDYPHGDEINETNKNGKFSIAPNNKKKSNLLTENKQTLTETSNKITNNTPNTTETRKDSKYTTDTSKAGTVTMGHFKTVGAEKKNLKGEFSKKNEVMHVHQRTNSLFTPIVYDPNLDDNKTGNSNVANMMV